MVMLTADLKPGRPAHEWRAIVAEHKRKLHPIRYAVSLWLRRMATRVEP